MRVHLAAAVLLLATAACTSTDDEAQSPQPSPTAEPEVHWTYSGDRGPAQWGELSEEFEACETGKRQSPIDIVDVTPDGKKLGFSYKWASGTVLNNGHTIQVKPIDGGSITVDGSTYDLVQFHFHSPSEHELDGARRDLEMHLVHQDESGKLAVVGVFIKEGEANAAFDPFWEDLPSEEGDEVDLTAPVDAGDLLPDDQNAIYVYDGSLTTPPCTEGVQWILLPTTVEMSQEQIEAFGDLYDNNARPVQPLNDRDITSSDLTR